MNHNKKALEQELMTLERRDFDFVVDLVRLKELGTFTHPRQLVLSPCEERHHDQLQAAPESVERALQILAQFEL